MTVARKLVSLNVSPWSERAKWALDHHGLAYEVIEHIPVIGERRLRRLVGPDKPRATVPVLVAGAEVLTESWDIAAYADREGKGTPLIPPEHEASIRSWCTLADEAASEGRALVIAAILATGPALDEQGPPFVPRWFRTFLRPLSRAALKAFVRKYELALGEGESQTRHVRSALERLRAGLASSSPYLQGSFSYADIVMAGLIQGISPVDDRFLKIGPGSRAAWTNAPLAAQFADLVAWRDTVYALQRYGVNGKVGVTS